MGQCKSTQYGNVLCGNETRQGYKFCDECIGKGKKKAVEEATQKSMEVIVNSGDNRQAPANEMVLARQNGTTPPTVMGNIVEQVQKMLTDQATFEADAFEMYSTLRQEDWIKIDKAGVSIVNPIIGVYERAMDRRGRVLPMIAKLGIEQQAAQLDQNVYDAIRKAVSRTFQRLDFNDHQLKEANKIFAQELRDIAPKQSEEEK